MGKFSGAAEIALTGFPFVVRLNETQTEARLAASESKARNWDCTDELIAELTDSLRKLGFVGFEEGALKRALVDIMQGRPYLLCEGVLPVDGEDGYVVYHFETSPAEVIWRNQSDEEKIDFRQRNEINNVKTGELLAEVVPPKDPTNGTDVFGLPIPARKGRKVQIFAGPNVLMSEDRTQARAAISGSVSKIGRRIVVSNVRKCDGDVDFRTGNIDFNGDVIVKGDVRETFSVKASGNLIVEGVVDHADLDVEGDITVVQGIHGKEGVSVRAGGSISTAFAENATLYAKGDICVEGALINCETCAEGRLLLRSDMGKCVIGGRAHGVLGIEATTLGHPNIPVRTVVEFGRHDPALYQKLRLLGQQVEDLNRTLKKTDSDNVAAARLEEVNTRFEELREEVARMERAKVVVLHAAYPGVVFVSGRATFEVRQSILAMVYAKSVDRDEIITHRLSGRS